jgi:hypothetical protein
MNANTYLAALDARIRALQGIITSWSIQREMDANLGIGFIQGSIAFVDGSRLEFTEQLPTKRQKFRIHYMDAQHRLIARWDSAPHHKGLATFPFHRHTPSGLQEHEAITLLEALDKVVAMTKFSPL